ncbi:S41 family peptidase [Pedobacter namyangjuensis]|uniref:S41 family peptidase n=1 Tax=Pedobacter namyangjuensis TaxID=600626 RepID=UPI000DE3F63B|nr:S41 family peptidase [Pedobacter namyangjuensis]
MKQIISLLLLLFSFGAYAQTQQQIDNEYAFAKVYGYLKYFYPGDDATKIDWDKFAIYGAQKVENCKNDAELKNTLNSLVSELMPGVKILGHTENYKFDANLLTPKSLKGYDVVSWQHLGVGTAGDKRALYQSARTNRTTVFKPKIFLGRANAYKSITDTTVIPDKNFKLTYRSKLISGEGEGSFSFVVTKRNKQFGFFKNNWKEEANNKTWNTFSIEGRIDQDATAITFGPNIVNSGKYAVDDISLKIDGREIYSTNFESDTLDKNPTSINFFAGRSSIIGSKYTFTIKEESGNKFLLLESPNLANQPDSVELNLFKEHPKFGEYAEKHIGNNLKVVFPLALYGTKKNTYPIPDSLKTTSFLSKINDTNYTFKTSDSYFKLGNIINIWNVFQHFYPYFDVAKTDWNQDLKQALHESYKTKDADAYFNVLTKLTAKLKDGHIHSSYPENKNFYMPPIAWKWVGKDLLITSVLDSKLSLKKGDVVKKINGLDVATHFKKINETISAATEGYLKHRSKTESLIGEKDTPLSITIENGQEFKMTRNIFDSDYHPLLPKQDTIKSLGNDITYISISNADMKTIDAALPLLQKSKAIICDLRGRSNENALFIQYLMTRKDTSSKWMQIPKIIYPDQENIAGYENLNWGVKPKSPHLNAKIFFLIDGQAISAAESFMSFIEHYKLATIIGQPTAGTNGNVNSVSLPGGYSFRFTGMKVLKHDGSQHHGIGILPNIYVEQTAKGISEGRDEILERAIAEANK